MKITRNSGRTSGSSVAVLDSEGSTTATRTGTDIVNAGYRGIIIHVNTANKDGTTAEYRPRLQAKYDDGTYVTYWQAAATLTATGDAQYVIYPGGSGGNVTEVDGLPLPQVFRLLIVVEGTTNGTHNMDTLMDAHLLI